MAAVHQAWPQPRFTPVRAPRGAGGPWASDQSSWSREPPPAPAGRRSSHKTSRCGAGRGCTRATARTEQEAEPGGPTRSPSPSERRERRGHVSRRPGEWLRRWERVWDEGWGSRAATISVWDEVTGDRHQPSASAGDFCQLGGKGAPSGTLFLVTQASGPLWREESSTSSTGGNGLCWR